MQISQKANLSWSFCLTRWSEMMRPFAKGNYTVSSADRPWTLWDLLWEGCGSSREEISWITFCQYPDTEGTCVGFYFFPVYIDETLKQKLGLELLQCLRVKPASILKRMTPGCLGQVKQALELCLEYYGSRGWHKTVVLVASYGRSLHPCKIGRPWKY